MAEPAKKLVIENESEEATEPPAMTRARIGSNNRDTIGAIFLAIVAIMLLVALLRSQKQLRDLLSERFYAGD